MLARSLLPTSLLLLEVQVVGLVVEEVLVVTAQAQEHRGVEHLLSLRLMLLLGWLIP
jgi:hypothetical protein